MIHLRPRKRACLSATRARFVGEGITLAFNWTQVLVSAPSALEWEVCAPQDMAFRVQLHVSATLPGVRCSLHMDGCARQATLDATQGVFPPGVGELPASSGRNFEQRYLGRLQLSRGEHTIRLSIDSLPDGCELHVGLLLLEPDVLAWPAGADYGVMIHWTAQSQPRTGGQLTYSDAVEAFDVPRLMDELEQMGAKYLIFTANHEYPHFPGPLAAWEEEFPGQTARRDLLRELADALHARGMGLVLYVNPFAAYIRSPRVDRLLGAGFRSRFRSADVMPMDCLPDYEEMSVKLVRAIGERYGKAIDGFWFDSCYPPYSHWPTYDIEGLISAAREGHPDRAVCVNSWILPPLSRSQDYWAGETYGLCAPPQPGQHERVPNPGQLFHTMLVMDDNDWVHAQCGPVEPARFTADELAEYIRKCRAIDAPVTINMGIYQDGGFGEESFSVMRQTKALLR